jgi:hypothetical protein
MSAAEPPRGLRARVTTRFIAISWRDLAISFGPLIVLAGIAVWLAIWLIHPAPPDTITLSAGPPGSSFWVTAQKYRKILAANGVTVVIEDSAGSLDNLRKLSNPDAHVDVGFVQAGLASSVNIDHLISLGSIEYLPVALFYRSRKPLRVLSELRGERIAIGPLGSGTRALALTLLKANGIEPGGETQLLELAGSPAAKALQDGQVDAVFLMGDSATPPTMGSLLRSPGIRLFDFTQAGAYARRFSYLNELRLPMGVFDLGKNLPARDIRLIAPTAELIARDSLHPALSDLLIEAARQVHGGADLLQHAGEFPSPRPHEFAISDDATRYYASGKGFLYRHLPFWVASLVDRMLVVLVPVIVLLIPGLRLVPAVYRWRVKSRIYRWYGALIAIERGMLDDDSPEHRARILARLDEIEDAVNRMKMPLAFADQFYVLREHIGFVRSRLGAAPGTARPQS